MALDSHTRDQTDALTEQNNWSAIQESRIQDPDVKCLALIIPVLLKIGLEIFASFLAGNIFEILF